MSTSSQLPLKQDRLFPFTRILAAFVIPFLITAFLILYLAPGQARERFAWPVQPAMSAIMGLALAPSNSAFRSDWDSGKHLVTTLWGNLVRDYVNCRK